MFSGLKKSFARSAKNGKLTSILTSPRESLSQLVKIATMQNMAKDRVTKVQVALRKAKRRSNEDKDG